jgi:hypothetical protein
VWVFVSNSLPVAHFAVGHSIARSSAKQGHGYLAIEVYIELIVDLIVEPPSLPPSLPLANQMAFVEPIDTSGGGSRHSYESID